MNIRIKFFLSSALIAACAAISAPSAYASVLQSDVDVAKVSVVTFENDLKSHATDSVGTQNLRRWAALSPGEKARVVAVVNKGGSTPTDNVSEAVTSGTSSTVRRAGTAGAITPQVAATNYDVHSWYKKDWSILGISYASAKLDFYYVTNGTSMVSVGGCVPSYSNYVPLRSISANNTISYLDASHKGVCRTTWSLTRLNFATSSSEQGMRVNGKGIEATWGP